MKRFPPLSIIILLAVCGIAVISGCAGTPSSPSAAAPPTPATVAVMAQNCFTCHGPNGVSPGAIPSLHPLSAAQIAAQFKLFRSGERPSTVMGRHAKAYTDVEIEALAKHIAGLRNN